MENNSDSIPFELRISGRVDPQQAPELASQSALFANDIGQITVEQSIEIRLNVTPSTIAIEDKVSSEEFKVISGYKVVKHQIDREELNSSLKQMGKLIENRRREKKWSIQTLNKLSGVSQSYISMIENGFEFRTERPPRPSFKILLKLAHSLDMSLRDLAQLAGLEIIEPSIDPMSDQEEKSS